MSLKLPMTSSSGAYIYEGPREMQLYADIAHSDGLVAVCEVDTDCRGRVYLYFMRGGIGESIMTVREARSATIALAELVAAATGRWPSQMKEDPK